MTFMEALDHAIAGKAIRRRVWQDGIIAYVARDGRTGGAYLAACHVAACELPGVRAIADLIADDWEIAYPDREPAA